MALPQFGKGGAISQLSHRNKPFVGCGRRESHTDLILRSARTHRYPFCEWAAFPRQVFGQWRLKQESAHPRQLPGNSPPPLHRAGRTTQVQAAGISSSGNSQHLECYRFTRTGNGHHTLCNSGEPAQVGELGSWQHFPASNCDRPFLVNSIADCLETVTCDRRGSISLI